MLKFFKSYPFFFRRQIVGAQEGGCGRGGLDAGNSQEDHGDGNRQEGTRYCAVSLTPLGAISSP